MKCPRDLFPFNSSKLASAGTAPLLMAIANRRDPLSLLLASLNKPWLSDRQALTTWCRWLCLRGLKLLWAVLGIGRVEKLKCFKLDRCAVTLHGHTGMSLGALLIPTWCCNIPFDPAEIMSWDPGILTRTIGAPLALMTRV